MSPESSWEPWEGCKQGKGRGSSGCRKTPQAAGDKTGEKLGEEAGGEDGACAGAWPVEQRRKDGAERFRRHRCRGQEGCDSEIDSSDGREEGGRLPAPAWMAEAYLRWRTQKEGWIRGKVLSLV